MNANIRNWKLGGDPNRIRKSKSVPPEFSRHKQKVRNAIEAHQAKILGDKDEFEKMFRELG